MKKRLIATVLGASLVLSMGVTTPVSAQVLIQNGQPQVESVSTSKYTAEGWSGLPDYQEQVVDPYSIFEGPTQAELNSHNELDGSWDYGASCEPVMILWLYNWKGIHPEENWTTMTPKWQRAYGQWLKKQSFNDGFNFKRESVSGKSISEKEQIAKDYLDKGCLLSTGHPKLIIGYAVKDGKTWFEYLETEGSARGYEDWHKWETASQLFTDISIDVFAKDLSVKPLQCEYRTLSGEEKSTTVYQSKLGDYYYKVLDLPEISGKGSAETARAYASKLKAATGASNTILSVSSVVNINGEAYMQNSGLQVVNGRIIHK